MDIAHLSPHQVPLRPEIIAPLPPTIEMTGFSGSRHFLEQQETVRHGALGQTLDVSPLDYCNH